MINSSLMSTSSVVLLNPVFPVISVRSPSLGQIPALQLTASKNSHAQRRHKRHDTL